MELCEETMKERILARQRRAMPSRRPQGQGGVQRRKRAQVRKQFEARRQEVADVDVDADADAEC